MTILDFHLDIVAIDFSTCHGINHWILWKSFTIVGYEYHQVNMEDNSEEIDVE